MRSVPGETDSEERGRLQRKAYGRAGGLTDAEARRLRELEDARPALMLSTTAPARAAEPPTLINREHVPQGTAAIASRGAAVPPGAEAQEPFAGTDGTAAGSGSTAETGSSVETGGERRRSAWLAVPRRRWGLVAAASALLLAIGVGAGWALFGQRPEVIPLTEEQQQRRLELYEQGEYDPGTLRAVGQDDDALVWYGTREDGRLICVVMDVQEASSDSCEDRDAVGPFGLSTFVMVPDTVDADADPAVASGTSVNVYMMFSTTGEPMVSIQRWTPNLTMVNQFQGDERARATELFEQGFSMGLSLVGYFQDEPVWLGSRFADGDDATSFEQCMIIDAPKERPVCSTNFDLPGAGLFAVVDGVDGGVPVSWTIGVQNTQNQTPFLTITRDSSFTSPSSPGDTVRIESPPGDPIRVEAPPDDPGE